METSAGGEIPVKLETRRISIRPRSIKITTGKTLLVVLIVVFIILAIVDLLGL